MALSPKGATDAILTALQVTPTVTSTPTPAPTLRPVQLVLAPPAPIIAAPAYGPGTIQAKILSVFGSGWLGTQALCIARAESNFRSDATGLNYKNGVVISKDRGIYQINNVAHPDFPDALAYEADANIAYAHQMRLSWGSWRAWSTANRCGVN